jgi:hypothetical protein
MVAAVPGLKSILDTTPAQADESYRPLADAEVGAANRGGPVVAQVTDIRTGEINIYQGESQAVLKDPALAARLYRASASNER